MKPSTIKNIFLIVITAIGCWLLFGKCQSDAETKQATRERDSVLTVKEIVSKSYTNAMLEVEDIQKDHDATKERYNELLKTKQQSDSSLKYEQSRADKYVALYKQAKGLKDTAGQLSNCDGIVAQYDTLKSLYNDASNNCNAAIFNQSRQIFQLDSIRGIQQRQLAGMKSALDLLGATITRGNEALKQPWVKGYLGLGINVGPALINNAGPELTFITRDGFLLGGGAKFGNVGMSGDVRVGKIITFKKK